MTTQIITRTTGRKAGSTFGAEPSSRIATRPSVWKWVAAAALLAGLAACSNNDDSWSPQVSGKVTYDHVPTASSGSGDSATAKLDYDATAVMPARNIVVELVDNASGDVLESTTTADDGSYTLKLPVSATLYLRARAHSVHGSPDAPDWSFTVRDNTTGDISADPDSTLEYSIVGEAFDTGFENHSRDLHAASGWTGSGYDAAARAAGPFQVLDIIETAARKLQSVEPDLQLPALNVFWSPKNRPIAEGQTPDDKAGLLLTSLYVNTLESEDVDAADRRYGLFLLGAENVDTDEYDLSVVAHEFGHYVEDKLSRADNIGGEHSNEDVLDMRVAFGEGWGDGFSSIVRETPTYVDTIGPQQAQPGLVVDVSKLPDGVFVIGWTSQLAVSNMLYTLNQAPEVGFAPIYETLRNEQRVTPAQTSLFSFATYLRARLAPGGQAVLDNLLAKVNTVNGTQLDIWGSNQTLEVPGNPGLDPLFTPVTTTLSATPQKVCLSNTFGTDNKLANWRVLRIEVAGDGRYNLLAKPVDTGDDWAYGFMVWQAGKEQPDQSSDSEKNIGRFDLKAGEFAAVVSADKLFGDDAVASPKMTRCVEVSIAAN